MEQDYKLIGAPCAMRGPYTFYKAFKYTKNGVTNILTINEFFFVKLWNDSDFISIGELRLLWEDQSCDKALASLRLYILPENTPDGRVGDVHGEDEVLAITEKVIIKLEDLLTWITDASDWHWGLSSVWTKQTAAAAAATTSTSTSTSAVSADCVKTEERVCEPDGAATAPTPTPHDRKVNGSLKEIECHRANSASATQNKCSSLEDCSAIDYSDVLKEKSQLDFTNWETRTGVLVLSYSRYCRYRALLRRLEGSRHDWLRDDLIAALGGFTTTYRTTKILFCRDTFDYPELEGHELLCNHLAPKLRSRIPKKKKTLYPSPDVSESDASSDYGTEDDERSSSASSCSSSANSNNSLANRFASNFEQTGAKRPDYKKLPHNNQVSTARQAFTQNLYAFMKARLTPIGKLPMIGNKELNLYEFYHKVKLLGNYASVTNNKLWKYVFEELGGDRGDPSMATLTRKYYEKFLLPYEQHMLQQLKHSSINQSTSVVPGSGSIIKSQCLPSTLNADYRYQADRRKVVTTVRPVPGGVRLADSKSTAAAMAAAATSAMQMLMMKSSSPSSSLSLQSVTGGKENIPLSRKVSGGGGGGGGGGASSAATELVIDLCAEEEGSSRRTPPRKSNPTEPEVIDLCEELPIRRSVPSIAATLLPRKRKLDILREGGLEVTPVASAGGGSGGGGAGGPSSRSLTISRRLPPASVAISAIASGETSLEVIDPKRSQKNRSNRAPSQILDLRTMRHAHAAAAAGGGGGGSEDENSLVKKFSPNLGPNIEISLVGNDAPSSASAASNGGGGGGVNSLRRDEKKRKSIPLPIPALRKISTGELSVQNLAASEDNNMFEPKITLTSRKTSSSDVTFTKAPSKSSSPAASAAAAAAAAASAHMKDNQTTASRLQHVNPSLYLAAFYNSMYPESDSETFISAHDGADSANPYQIQLTQQQISYVKGAFMHQPGQQLDIDTATEAFAQKFTNMLKNGSVSIVENYEKILPD